MKRRASDSGTVERDATPRARRVRARRPAGGRARQWARRARHRRGLHARPGTSGAVRAATARAARRHGVHLSEPGAVDRAVGRRGGRPVDHRRGAPIPLRRAGAPDRPERSHRPIRLDRPLRPAAGGVVGDGARAPPFRVEGGGVRRRQLDRGSGGRVASRHRLVREERKPAVAARGQLVRVGLRDHGRGVAGGSGAGGRRMRDVPSLHRCVPHGRDHRTGCDRRQPMPRVAPAEARGVPTRVPGGARGPPVRLRRLPGGVPAERSLRRVPGRARPARRGVGERRRAARVGRRRRCSRGTSGSTSPGATRGGSAATR